MPAFPAVSPGFAPGPLAWRCGVRILLASFLGGIIATPASGQVPAPPQPGAAAGDPPAAEVERLKALSTSDGAAIAAWYYPVAEPESATDRAGASPAPVVILLHDLGGSHKSVEPLALALQERGIAVVAPDLRGHGASTGGAGIPADTAALKKADFESMAATGGGRVREQAATIGDVEAVRNWITAGPEAGKLDLNKLVVVGSGVGAAVATQWTIRDSQWPDLASGPQGRQVRGLVLVSPAWTTRSFAIAPALGVEPVQRSLPILVIGGAQDADAVKIYDQLKRKRLDSWSEKRVGQAAATQAPKLKPDELPTLYLRQFDTGLSGDRLAAYVPKDPSGGGHPAAIIEAFIGAITAEAE